MLDDFPEAPADAPSTSDPSTFNTRASAFLQWFSDLAGYTTTAFTQLETDLAALTDTVEAMKFPVGHVLLSYDSANPSTYLLYGTWQLSAVGRAIVGADHGEGGDLFGSDERTLTQQQLPEHAHGAGSLSGTAQSAGAHNHTVTDYIPNSGSSAQARGGGNEGVSTDRTTSTDGAHTHAVSITGSTGNIGSGSPIDVRQRSIKLYAWRRTA